jgi:hypothetical protein
LLSATSLEDVDSDRRPHRQASFGNADIQNAIGYAAE